MKVEPIRDKETIRRCLAYLGATNKRNQLLFAVGIYTGLRISDILTLRVKDVYCKNYISIKQKKTKNYVEIPINKELKKLIKEYCKEKMPYEYLFESRQKNSKGVKGPITVGQAHNIIKDVAEYCCGYENISTHSLRKTFGYNLYQKKKDIGEVMVALGQKDQGSTLRYIGVTEMDVQRSIKSLSYYN